MRVSWEEHWSGEGALVTSALKTNRVSPHPWLGSGFLHVTRKSSVPLASRPHCVESRGVLLFSTEEKKEEGVTMEILPQRVIKHFVDTGGHHNLSIARRIIAGCADSVPTAGSTTPPLWQLAGIKCKAWCRLNLFQWVSQNTVLGWRKTRCPVHVVVVTRWPIRNESICSPIMDHNRGQYLCVGTIDAAGSICKNMRSCGSPFYFRVTFVIKTVWNRDE